MSWGPDRISPDVVRDAALLRREQAAFNAGDRLGEGFSGPGDTGDAPGARPPPPWCALLSRSAPGTPALEAGALSGVRLRCAQALRAGEALSVARAVPPLASMRFLLLEHRVTMVS